MQFYLEKLASKRPKRVNLKKTTSNIDLYTCTAIRFSFSGITETKCIVEVQVSDYYISIYSIIHIYPVNKFSIEKSRTGKPTQCTMTSESSGLGSVGCQRCLWYTQTCINKITSLPTNDESFKYWITSKYGNLKFLSVLFSRTNPHAKYYITH